MYEIVVCRKLGVFYSKNRFMLGRMKKEKRKMRQLLGVNSKQSLKFLSTITETREPEPYCASKISNKNFHYTISCWRFIYNFFWWKHWWGSSHWNKVLMINLNICFWCKVLQTKSNHLFLQKWRVQFREATSHWMWTWQFLRQTLYLRYNYTTAPDFNQTNLLSWLWWFSSELSIKL
jgi:hypothetical protein